MFPAPDCLHDAGNNPAPKGYLVKTDPAVTRTLQHVRTAEKRESVLRAELQANTYPSPVGEKSGAAWNSLSDAVKAANNSALEIKAVQLRKELVLNTLARVNEGVRNIGNDLRGITMALAYADTDREDPLLSDAFNDAAAAVRTSQDVATQLGLARSRLEKALASN